MGTSMSILVMLILAFVMLIAGVIAYHFGRKQMNRELEKQLKDARIQAMFMEAETNAPAPPMCPECNSQNWASANCATCVSHWEAMSPAAQSTIEKMVNKLREREDKKIRDTYADFKKNREAPKGTGWY